MSELEFKEIFSRLGFSLEYTAFYPNGFTASAKNPPFQVFVSVRNNKVVVLDLKYEADNYIHVRIEPEITDITIILNKPKEKLDYIKEYKQEIPLDKIEGIIKQFKENPYLFAKQLFMILW
jgi:hypothetical protein